LPTLPAGLLEVHDDPIPDVRRVDVRADFDDAARDLVARDERFAVARLDAIEKMEVRVTHARREDLYEDVLGSRLRVRELDEENRSVGLESNCAHSGC
jgi:hypothetical protein